MIRNLFTLSLIVLLAACARNRGPEKLRTQTVEDWILKSQITGTGQAPDLYVFKNTIVKTSSNGGFGFMGLQSDVKAGYFEPTETTLKFKSIEGPYEGKESNSVVNRTIVEWPATHHDVRLDQSEGRITNREIDDDFKSWNHKKYIKPDFNMPNIGEEQTLPYTPAVATSLSCWTVASRERIRDSQQIEPGYFSFVTEVVYKQNPLCSRSLRQFHNADFTYTVQYRYSFRKLEKSDYKAFEYGQGEFDPLRQKFGFFQTVKPEKDTTVPGGVRHRFFANRWHPDKTHYFYFSKGTPEKYKPIFKDIFEQTNQLLAKTGKKIRFEIYDYNYNHQTQQNNGQPRQFGDLRYSFVNIVDELDPTSPLGYGPSDANPFTGEILAANTMIWTGSMDYYIERLKIVSKEIGSNKFEDNTLYIRMKNAMDIPVAQWETHWDMENQEIGKAYQQLVQDTNFNAGFYNPYTNHPGGLLDVPIHMDGPTKIDYEAGGTQSESGKAFRSYITKAVEIPDLMTVSQKYLNSQHHNGANVQSLRNFSVTDVLNDPGFEELRSLWQKGSGNSNISNYLELASDHLKHEHKLADMASKGHCMFPIEEAISGLGPIFTKKMLLPSNKAALQALIEKIKYTIVYRVSIHEFGHNLALRHNFFGTVDNGNFRLKDNPETAKYLPVMEDEDGNPMSHPDGSPMYHPQVSSSVMDYLRLEHETQLAHTWEDYDRAALFYAYSGGQDIEEGRNYLFCTDENTVTHALCNRFDLGSTPSEILLSQIEAYVSAYPLLNYRANRAFWDTSSYAGRVFSTMSSIKEFYPHWRTAFSRDLVGKTLDGMNIKNTIEQEAIFNEIDIEMRKVIKLSMAFYQSVLQQSAVDRPFRSVYDEGTGAIKRIGITADKLFAMLFLAGDGTMPYNPNRFMIHQSYLTHKNDRHFGSFSEKIWENVVTQRVDMEPWFISFGRALYAVSAKNFYNRDTVSFVNRIKLHRYSRVELEQNLGIQYQSDKLYKDYIVKTDLSPEFKLNEKITVVKIDELFYVVARTRNSYAYTVVKNVIEEISNGRSPVQAKLDLEELWWLSNYQVGSAQ